MSDKRKWVEISDACESHRFGSLSLSLTEAGVANEHTLIECAPDKLEGKLQEALLEFDNVRIGGVLREEIPKIYPRMPSTLLSLRSADAMVREGGEWWPRNFLIEGMNKLIVSDLKDLDLGGAIFVLGATPEARAAIAAFARFGFSRFTLSDPDIQRGQKFVDELRTLYFKVQFQFAPRHMITQLPSIHSAAINTLKLGRDDGALSELFYFNFLKPGGAWLDLPLVLRNTGLDAEALAVGAQVIGGARLASVVDGLWAKTAFGVELDLGAYEARLDTKPTAL